MANSYTRQVEQQGLRNFIIKLTGVLDTSDLSATGTLGAVTSGTTTLGSANVTFTAGGLTPVTGQYVTGAGIPAGTYVVSFTATTAVLSKVATASGAGLTFTLTAGLVIAIDPLLDFVGNPNYTGPTGISTVRIDHIDYSVGDQLEVQIAWGATTNVIIMPLAGRGRMSFWNFGGLQNNAGPGKTGDVLLQTTGWASGTQVFSVILECVKQYT